MVEITKLNLSDDFGMDAQDVLTGRGCVIGQSGSGKSFLIGVVVEELSKLGMSFCIIDTEGEYSSLKKQFNIIKVGGSNSDVGLDVNFASLLSASIENSIPVILDVSDSTDGRETVYTAMDALFSVESAMKKPYLVIIEEADKFVPQVSSKKANPIEEIAFRGRKRGIGLLIATQRPANISKNVLAQCSYGFIGKLTIDNDLNSIRILFSSRKELGLVTKLKTGEFLSFGTEESEKFRTRARMTEPMGSTPVLGSHISSPSTVRNIIKSLKGTGLAQGPAANGTGKGRINIPTLTVAFGTEQAKSLAERMRKKRFGVLGGVVEGVDAITVQYLPLTHCTLRIPTNGRNEYFEYNILITARGELLKLGRKVELIRYGTQKARTDSSTYKIYDSALSKSDFSIENSSVEKAAVLKGDQNNRRIKSQIAKFFPNAIIADSEPIYLPFYKIVLRSGNKVRVFSINAVDGKPLEVQ